MTAKTASTTKDADVRSALEELLPELREISDLGLREKTLAVWVRALDRGGWKPRDLSRIPFTLLVEGVPIHFLEHVRTVCRLCIVMHDVLVEAYGSRVKLTKDHLVSGALLADVGKLLEYEDKNGEVKKSRHGTFLRHPFTGVALAAEQGLPDEVLHVIAVHSKEGDGFKRSPEAVIFHHADFTDFDLVR